MESKSIKVVDEHGIDRVANIICAIQVQNIDYAVYWIERDSENDNIFVSKLLKNLDNTSSLINIEDGMEKSKISDIIKELIKYAIDNENTNLNGKKVVLSGGEVLITSVLVNKEQNINVQKTYITTVKKAVTKVASDYYETKEETVLDMPIFEDLPSVEQQVKEEEQAPIIPIIDIPEELFSEPKEEVKTVEPEKTVNPIPEPTTVIPEVNLGIPKTPEITFPDVKSEVLPDETPVNETNQVEVELSTPEAPIEGPSIEPITPVEIEPQPITPTPIVEPVPAPIDEKINIVSDPASILMNDKPVIPEPVLDVSTNPPTELVFDASKETNLNQALGEMSNENPLPVQDVEPIREFGVDSDMTQPTAPLKVEENKPVEPTTTGTPQSGFANNKFFMVIALVFFVASCVFLGYEVFRYFKLR